MADMNYWYFKTTLSHEFLFKKDQMDGTTFSKLDTVHWRCILPVHLCDFEAQIYEEGGRCNDRHRKTTGV